MARSFVVERKIVFYRACFSLSSCTPNVFGAGGEGRGEEALSRLAGGLFLTRALIANPINPLHKTMPVHRDNRRRLLLRGTLIHGTKRILREHVLDVGQK